jgi:hypothetical protein
MEVLENRCVPSTVNNLLDSGPGSLRQAIIDTPAGGMVDFQPGLSGTITLTTGELTIAKDLTIAGPGAGRITVSGHQATRVFDIEGLSPSVTISGLTITEGLVTGPTNVGGGIINNAILTVADCILSDNSASGATARGGGIWNTGTLTVTDSVLTGNSASQGGGIDNFGTLTVTGSTLSGNSGGQFGGGGVFNGTQAMLTVIGSTFSGNSAMSGGGIENGGTLATVSGSTFDGNSASAGGGIVNGGPLTVTGSSFSNNSAGQGGGILNSNLGTLTLTGCTVNGNSATGSAAYGGGIYNQGTLTVTDCTLSANSASGAGGRGGGIANYRPSVGTPMLTLIGSTLSGNSASVDGGAIYNSSGGPTQTRNTILAGNTGAAGPDLFGSLGSLGHNLIGNTQGGSGFIVSDLLNVDPMLGPLQDSGGPTQTMALLVGSPAIDAGDNTDAPATDQRGFPRIVGDAIDIGAVEVQPAGQTTHLGFQAPASIPVGTPFAITVTALDDFGQQVTGYLDTVHFTLLPAGTSLDYTFTTADGGQHIFSSLGLPHAQTDTVTGADSANPLITGNTSFTITPAAPDHIAFTVPSPITAGMPFAITVTVQDAYGNTVTGYTGTVPFTLTGQATAMADYIFTAGDMGSHTFRNLVLSQAGDYTLTGMDTGDPTISGDISFTVSG